jgi:hypothetical protein
MTSLFMSSFDTLTCASLDSHASPLMVFLLDVVGGMVAAACELMKAASSCCDQQRARVAARGHREQQRVADQLFATADRQREQRPPIARQE